MRAIQIKQINKNSLIFAIGDVHGMESPLDLVLLAIERLAADYDFTPQLVFLGDLIDRGRRSLEVTACVLDALQRFPGSAFILGNHDEYLRRLADGSLDQRTFDAWMANGGIATVDSFFGLPDIEFNDVPRLGRYLSEGYPEHVALLRGAYDMATFGKFAFVHAGIKPGIPLQLQSIFDLRWIRNEFLNSSMRFEKIIVHGHTPTQSGAPEVYPNRIALDTGAYFSKRLSACAFDENRAWFTLQTDLTSSAAPTTVCNWLADYPFF